MLVDRVLFSCFVSSVAYPGLCSGSDGGDSGGCLKHRSASCTGREFWTTSTPEEMIRCCRETGFPSSVLSFKLLCCWAEYTAITVAVANNMEVPTKSQWRCFFWQDLPVENRRNRSVCCDELWKWIQSYCSSIQATGCCSRALSRQIHKRSSLSN
jgi:hypothetical protein